MYTISGGKKVFLDAVEEPTFKYEQRLTMGETYIYRVTAVDADGEVIMSSKNSEDFFNPFEDVADDAANFDYIAWAYNSGLVNGTSDTTFNPEGHTSRMNFVMILWKMNGSPKVKGTNPFKDVTGSKKQKAILWAYKTGIVKGTSKTTFSPDVDLSRGNIIMILWKMAGNPEVSGSIPFTDVSGAKTIKTVTWAYNTGICEGVSETEFDPAGACSRALFVEILYKYNEIYHVMG